MEIQNGKIRLNPFGTGQCLSTFVSMNAPLPLPSLNPFGTGQCLSTEADFKQHLVGLVSIPLEQGNVFRR